MTAEAFPLAWPAGRDRTTARRARAKFDVTFARARDDLFHELKLLGATLPVLSTNIPLRRDGLPYAGQRQPDDPGVAVYFTKGKAQLCFACDRWDRVEHNIQAVVKTIDALRGISRWGTGDMVAAAFTGFQALPAPPTARRPWWEVLGLVVGQNTPDHQTVEDQYARLARQHHPDRGGDPAKMAELNAAIEAYRKGRYGHD